MLNKAEIANIVIRQDCMRSKFLAPLEGIENNAWKILIRIYAANQGENIVIESLARELGFQPHGLKRYLDVLMKSGYITQMSAGDDCVALVTTARSAMDRIFENMAQELVTSFD
jgi:DNA-binding MarR family transcriptional regulator